MRISSFNGPWERRLRLREVGRLTQGHRAPREMVMEASSDPGLAKMFPGFCLALNNCIWMPVDAQLSLPMTHTLTLKHIHTHTLLRHTTPFLGTSQQHPHQTSSIPACARGKCSCCYGYGQPCSPTIPPGALQSQGPAFGSVAPRLHLPPWPSQPSLCRTNLSVPSFPYSL